MKKPLPPSYFIAAIGLTVCLHFLAPWYQLIKLPWGLPGLLPIAAGIALNLIANQALNIFKIIENKSP
ncbi:MAG: hypothetical protein DWQ10_10830 [Calditrichaeota bacterium]|nr:MAG: hypothetical protein DWQ10_10830 [Calditrichota bacterium]